jgi:hypothetical protein
MSVFLCPCLKLPGVQKVSFLPRIISSSVACLALPCFSTLSHTSHDFRGKIIEYNNCVSSLQLFSETFLFLRKIQQEIMTNLHSSSRQVPVILVIFRANVNFLIRFSKNIQTQKLTTIRPVKVEFFHADRQTVRRMQRNDEANSCFTCPISEH